MICSWSLPRDRLSGRAPIIWYCLISIPHAPTFSRLSFRKSWYSCLSWAPPAMGPMYSLGRPWTFSWQLWSSAAAIVAFLDFGGGKKQTSRWSGDLVVCLLFRVVRSLIGVLLLLLFPFPASSLLSGSFSAKVTESTSTSSSRTSWSTFSTSWFISTFSVVVLGFLSGSFVVGVRAVSCPGPSPEEPLPFIGYYSLFWWTLFVCFVLAFFGISIFMKSTPQRLEVPLSIGISNLIEVRAWIRAVAVSGFAEISLSSL